MAQELMAKREPVRIKVENIFVRAPESQGRTAGFSRGTIPSVTFQRLFIGLSNCIHASCSPELRKVCQVGAGWLNRR